MQLKQSTFSATDILAGYFDVEWILVLGRQDYRLPCLWELSSDFDCFFFRSFVGAFVGKGRVADENRAG